jgi:Na+/proline symporter
VALLLIPGSLLWASAQIRAFGHVLAASGSLSEHHGILLAALLAVTYTSFGGLLADAYADLIQGGILITCLVVLLFAVISGAGGLEASWHLIAHGDPVDIGSLEAQSPLATLNDWAIPVIGSLFAQELVARTSASRSREVARRSALVAAAVYLVVGTIPVLLGAIAHRTLPGIDGEQVLALLAQKHLPRLGYVVFAGALVSAILSTVDSALLVCGSLVSHNLASALTRSASERQKIMLARVSVVALSGIAYVLARSAESVHGLVQEASAFGSTGICVAGCLGLFSRRGGELAAYAAILVGAVSWVVSAYVLESEVAFLISLAAALAGYGLSSPFEAGRAGGSGSRGLRRLAAHQVETHLLRPPQQPHD